jgi:kumamolisin
VDPAPAETDDLSRFAGYDAVVITWTAAEAAALAALFTPNHQISTWYEYRHGIDSYIPLVTGPKAPFNSTNKEDVRYYHSLGLYFPCLIGPARVLLFKSGLHLDYDGPAMPLKKLIAEIVQAVNPSLLITTGTAGAIGAKTALGDIVIAPKVRFDCTTQFKSQSFAKEAYPALAPSAAILAAITPDLLAVNASSLPKSPKPTVWHGATDFVVTTDFFAFDDSTDYYKLQGLGRMCDMGDAMVGLVMQQFPKVQFYSIRNASDPQIPNPNHNIGDANKESTEIYSKYGALTTAGSVIASWAAIATTFKTGSATKTITTSRGQHMPAVKVFNDSVIELPEQASAPHGLTVNEIRPEHLQEKMPLEFSLNIPADLHANLEAKVAKGIVVPVDELNKQYAVPTSEVRALVDWLKGQGFEVTSTSKDGTSVYARANAGQIEKSLGVKMVRVTKGGLTYTAARNAPSLPADIAGSVHAILGLQPFRHPQKHLRFGPTVKAAASAKANNKPPYKVPEILKAYNADGLGLTGAGQTIAILIDCFPLQTDLTLFWKDCGVNASLSRIQMINVNGGTLPAPEGEETLDASWTSGVAPGATIRIYATGSLEFTALDQGLDMILSDLATQPGMRQLSISMGLGETYYAAAEMRTQQQKYLRLAAAGVNVFVSSGDAGSNPDSTGQNSDGPLQVEYPASDTNVVGVGGTTLVLVANGNVARETGWAGSGGGKSRSIGRPSWQVGAGVSSGKQRLVPDVSLTADPADGVFLILNGKPFPGELGGTSWSAPCWAGFCALINEARANAGKPALAFLNPLMYPLLGSPCFRDIVSGTNGAYDAGPGYDMVTGIGVPDVQALLAKLT